MQKLLNKVKIFLSLDMDYGKDYENLDKIFATLGNTPATVFVVGSKHPEQLVKFPPNIEIGNHSFLHAPDWYETTLEFRVEDLERNHQFIKEKYGVECQVYRSPHLRNFTDTADEMEKRGYRREMACVECSVCQPLGHAHLKQYFSSFHHFRSHCNLSFVENFENICKKGKDFTFFLDAHDFTDERLKYLKEIIKIGKEYGNWKLLSDTKSL